ncbi:MAG: nucleotidyltransferase domain-containing protein [Nitrospirae bacterium]|nr:nucleotidyltransferase domain-containing protein [Nitrospirota bacterium]
MDIIRLLFKSKIRQNILAVFIADESRKFYINELARKVNTSQGTCRRELNKLAEIGLLVSSRTGNLQYYEINKKTPFYNEFRTIIQKTIGIEAIIKGKLQGLKGITFAFIFGSYAKKEFKPGSDIDIVIIGTVREDRLAGIFRDVEKEIGREINYHLYSLQEFKNRLKTNSFTKNIIENYIIVAGDDGNFRTLLGKA